MWGKMQKGFQSMDLFQSEVLKLMQKIEQVKFDFLRQMRKQERKIDFSCCLAIKKLKLLFYLFILNDSLTAFHLEEEIIELRKRDAFSEKDTLTNENLIKKNIASVTISISQHLGMIKSKKDFKTAQFFGFNVQEFQKINKINELMPHFIEKNHDNMIKQFVTRGTSQYIKSFLYSFCVNSKGYVMPVKVYTDFSFLSLDDFYIQGTILKVNKGSQYIVFDRSGKIVGITEKLAQKIFIDSDIMKNLPPAEQAIKYLNALLLFPQIVSKLQKKKKFILQNFEQQHTDIVLQSDKGYFYFDSQLIDLYQQFSSYLEKKSSMIQNKNQNRNLEKSNKINEINLLDVLSKDSIRKYHKFIKSQAKEKSLQSSSRYTLAQSSKNQNSISKNRGTFFSTTNNSQSVNTQFMKTIFRIQKQKFFKFFKLSFKYSLSYHTLPLFGQFEENKTENNNISTIQTNKREIYFSLQLDDCQLKENQKQNINQHENTFQENLVNYLMKLTCIPALQQLNKSILQQSEDEEVLIKEQSSNIDRKIPKSFLKFLNQNARRDKRQQINLEAQSENSNRQKQSKIKIQDSENQTGSYYDTSSSESESNSQDQSFGEDIYNYKSQEEKNVLMQKKVSEKFQNIQTKLDDILDENEISVADMLALDSYYKAKRVILQNSNAGNLISALEIAIAEELLELKKEKQVKSHYYTTQNSSEVSINVQNNMNQNEGQITFRNLQSNHINNKQQNSSKNLRSQFQKLNSDISGLSLSKQKQQSSHSLQLIQDKLEQISHQEIDAYQENIEYSNINLRPAEQSSSFANISHRYNVSQDNLTTHNLNQTFRNSQVNVSSRPLILQNKEISSNLLDSVTHVSLDENTTPQKQRSFLKQISSAIENISENQNLRKSTSKKFSFIKNSTALAHNSDLQNNLKIKFVQNSYLEQDIQYKNLSTLPTNQQMQSNVTQNFQNISDSSKLGVQKKSKLSRETHEDFMKNLLNNGGLVEGLGERVSIHSSSRSSSSQVGFFLKEIIQKGKVPNGAKSYSILLIIFTLIFIGLNLTNLFIIQNDMQTFSDSSLIIRSPRKLLKNYAKSLYGKYILLQLQTNYLKDTSDKYFQKLGNQYLINGATDYIGILQSQSIILIKYLQKYTLQQNSTTYPFTLYNTYVQNRINLEISLFFENVNYDLICNQLNYTETVQNNCFTTLRANFFNYGTTVVNFVQFVVDIIVDTAVNLILKFTYISVAAIICVIVIPLCAIPFAKNINSYEEKILMIVSRIYFSHSQIERQKLHICQQLIQLDDSEWLKYNYNEVFSLKYKMFDHSITNNIQQIQAHQTSKKVETLQDQENINYNQKKQKYSTQSKLQGNRARSGNNQSEQKQKTQKEQKNTAKKIVRNALSGRENNQQRLQSNFDSGSIQNRGKDYILQSRIQNQKLSIIKRIQSLLVFMTVAIVYFLIIIIYLNLNSSDLQQPVQINRQTNLLHVNSINYLISSEFLAYDLKLKKIWPLYDINDLKSFYDITKSSLNNIQDQSNTLTETIYGNNPYSPEVDQKMKNLIEGYVCPYMTSNNCTGDINQLTSFGIKNAVSQFFKIHNSFLNVFDPSETPDDQLISYLNAQERVTAFTNFFKTQDEVFDVFSSTANQSITSVSNGIQQFIQNFLIYCGSIVALLIVILFTYSTKNLYKKIQLTNLFLIFIPEEKLLEEVTLQMLKNIQKM